MLWVTTMQAGERAILLLNPALEAKLLQCPRPIRAQSVAGCRVDLACKRADVGVRRLELRESRDVPAAGSGSTLAQGSAPAVASHTRGFVSS